MRTKNLILGVFISVANFFSAYSQDFEFEEDAYYMFYNGYQGKGMVLSKASGYEHAIMGQRIFSNNALWQVEPAGEGMYYIKNVEAGEKGYLHVYDTNWDGLLLSEKKESINFKWSFRWDSAREDGFVMSNNIDGLPVMDCDSNPTGGALFVVSFSDATGQYWTPVKVKKLPIIITSIRFYINDTLVIAAYEESPAEAIRRTLEVNGTFKLTSLISSEISVDEKYTIDIEYIKNDRIIIKKFKKGDVIDVYNF